MQFFQKFNLKLKPTIVPGVSFKSTRGVRQEHPGCPSRAPGVSVKSTRGVRQEHPGCPSRAPRVLPGVFICMPWVIINCGTQYFGYTEYIPRVPTNDTPGTYHISPGCLLMLPRVLIMYPQGTSIILPRAPI